MRVLVVHNRYSSRVPSGENLAVDDEIRWLREAGVDVHTHQVSNDDVFAAGRLGQLRQGAESLWSLTAQHAVRNEIGRVQPDLLHVHNLFPLLTASVVRYASKRLPVLWTVHNHRVLCVSGTNFRDGAPCHLCRPGWRLPGIQYTCYGNTQVGSALVTAASSIFRGVAKRHVTAVAISNRMSEWLAGTAGFSADRIRVKYNGVDRPPDDDYPAAESQRVLVFAGRLTDYKGVTLLLDAWQRAQLPPDVELRFVGDGPLAGEVAQVAARDPRVVSVGQVPVTEMPAHFAAARAIVFPSLWEEPFGRVAAEALAYGRPVITTGTGGLSEIVDDDCGWITGRSPEDLARALEAAVHDDAAVAGRADAARRRHAERFSPEATTAELVRIYENEMER